MVEEEERRSFWQKIGMIPGIGSFAGMVISFYNISVITASNPNCERYKDRYLIAAVDACSPPLLSLLLLRGGYLWISKCIEEE